MYASHSEDIRRQLVGEYERIRDYPARGWIAGDVIPDEIAESARIVGKRTAVAAKALLYRLRLRILGACVLAAAVGLPDLDRGIVDRPAVAVEHPSFDAHALARNALRRAGFD